MDRDIGLISWTLVPGDERVGSDGKPKRRAMTAYTVDANNSSDEKVVWSQASKTLKPGALQAKPKVKVKKEKTASGSQ